MTWKPSKKTEIDLKLKGFEIADEPVDLIAKKDFEIKWNDYHRVIRKGDELSDVPEMFHANLKTEKVL